MCRHDGFRRNGSDVIRAMRVVGEFFRMTERPVGVRRVVPEIRSGDGVPRWSGRIIDVNQMLPDSPPFPTPRNRPFHFSAAGSHTSAWMSESDEGVNRSATRQNENGADTVSSFRPLPCAVNGSRTSVAEVIVAPGTTSAETPAQPAAPAIAETGAWNCPNAMPPLRTAAFRL